MVLTTRPVGRRARAATGAAAMMSLASMVLAGTPATASAERAAQDPSPRAPAPGEQGWVGLQVDFVANSARRARDGDYTVVITDVVSKSPAAEAGVQPGDTLLAINGSKPSPTSFEKLRTALRAGDVIRLAVRRRASQRALEVVAASRPTFVFAPNPPELAFRIDSVRTAILRKADSLRRDAVSRSHRIEIRHLTTHADSFVTVLDLQSDERPERSRHRGSMSVSADRSRDEHSTVFSWSFHFEEAGTPQSFESLVVHTPRTDSLRASIARLRSELERVKRTEGRLANQLEHDRALVRAARDGRSSNADSPAAAELTELRSLGALIATRLAERVAELRSVSRAELEAARAATVVAPAPEPVEPVEAPVEVAVRPITPYLVGRSYLAGARVAEMNEGLGEYFGVAEGVLVTDVADGTPASDSGIRAGDVIVGVDDQSVRDVRELRSRLTKRWSGAALTVVRRGERLSVVLSR